MSNGLHCSTLLLASIGQVCCLNTLDLVVSTATSEPHSSNSTETDVSACEYPSRPGSRESGQLWLYNNNKKSRKIPPAKTVQMALETSEMYRHDKMPLLDNGTIAQIQVVAAGGLSNVSKASKVSQKVRAI